MRQVLNLSKKLLSISILCIGMAYCIINVISKYARDNYNYLAASLDKEQLLQTTKSPRYIFVGGSNLALGINSQRISKELNSNVVNMGLHAALGLSYILNEVKSNIHRGDTIVLSIEHFLGEMDIKHMAQLIDVNPNARLYINTSFFEDIQLEIMQLQRCFSSTFYKLINRNKDPYYFRKGFTIQGDLISHYGQPKPVHVSGNTLFPKKDYSGGIQKINKFILEAEARGAIVYFTFPTYPASSYRRNEKSLLNLESQYKHSLKCTILGNVRTFVLDDKYFFDTVYHLDSLGVEKRTQIMIESLKAIKHI